MSINLQITCKERIEMNVSEKMYRIAEKFNELKDGKVKSFSGNEKGYAKILQIGLSGASVQKHTVSNSICNL